MNNKLYKLMNWPEIEAVVYCESLHPSDVCGPHVTGNSTLYQVFVPDATEVRLRFPSEDKSVRMEQVDEAGFFACLIPGKTIPEYEYIAETSDGKIKKIIDAYRYKYMLDSKFLKDFEAGRIKDVYKYLGAHVTEIDGCRGTGFSIWAPNARRVSVVGEFNNWDGRIHQMNLNPDSGVFSLFIPGVDIKDEYLFEINTKGGVTKTIIDPYSITIKNNDNWFTSVISDLDGIKWSDKNFMKNRAAFNNASEPISIYECSLKSYADKLEHPDYTHIGSLIIKHAKDLGYTHVEIKPVAEYEKEESCGYETIGFYAPTSRYGTYVEFARMIDDFHKNGIKVILDWTLAHPSAANFALRKVDGTGCYEHEDPRQGIQPEWGTLLFNYGRGAVVSFLASNALYWLNEFHLDGLRVDSLAPILCLDYGKKSGDWIPNMYGGRENLDAVDFIRNLNRCINKEFPGVLMIAEDSSAWQKVTESVDEGGLGFSYKWNIGWRDDYYRYISIDPLFRGGNHNDLTLSMIYFYSDKFILPLSNPNLNDIKLSIAYMMVHPGIKLLSEGLDSCEDKSNTLSKLVKNLNHFYKSYPALHELDNEEEGFEWINCMDSSRSTLSFIRRGKRKNDTLVVVVNFAGVAQSIDVGISVPGKYTRIFNTDASIYGGSSKGKEDPIYTIDEDVDSRPYYIPVTLPALSLSIYEYSPFDENDREYMVTLQQETKKKAEEARELAQKEDARAKAAKKKAEAEQKKAEEAARIAEETRRKAEEEYRKAEIELERAYEAMERAKEAAAKAERAAHRLEITEESMRNAN